VKVWIIVRSILFGIAKLAGAVVVLGFSLGIAADRKLKANLSDAVKEQALETEGAAEEMTKAIEDAAKQVIKDLEDRTAVAVRLLDEAEEKIARLKDMVDVYEDYVLDEPVPEDTISSENAAVPEEQLPVCDETEKEKASQNKHNPDKHNLVFQLADEGLGLQEIARKAGIGYGEAELILNLRSNND